jgi:SET and MYND domain-containing protein
VKIAWFCLEACLTAWRNYHDDAVCHSLAALEIFSREYGPFIESNATSSEETRPAGKVVDASEVDSHWQLTEGTAEKIREARQRAQPEKRHRKILQLQSLSLKKNPDLNLDVVSYFLRGIISRYKSLEDWQTVYPLVPSIIAYQTNLDGLRVLKSHCLAYSLLELILPKELLPLCDQESLRTLTSRDCTNAFGLWSDSGDEYLGYGVWVKASLFNHSCDPNVRKYTQDRAWIFETARYVVAGEELCISYLGSQDELKMDVMARREKLLKHWGFLCLCTRCITELDGKSLSQASEFGGN